VTAAAPAPAQVSDAAAPLQQPEIATGWSPKTGARSAHFMVAAANPLATEAGYDILRAGGSALDAAVAVQMVLNLVEPQSSGIGGGSFLMSWDGRAVQAWDGRETAPAGVNPRMFIDAKGQPLPYRVALLGGRAVATPGTLKMLEAAWKAEGRLPWASLFEPAIRLAEQGFAVSPRLHESLAEDEHLRDDPGARAYFFDDQGQPWPVGHRLRNPALAAVLRRIAAEGSAALYAGPVAADIVQRVHASPVPGTLSLADLAGYQPVERAPLCTDWLQRWRVCGFPPPSSGHLTIMQTLGMLERLPPAAQALLPAQGAPLDNGVPSAAWLHLYTEASRLAFADRDKYIADPAFVSAPNGHWNSLLNPAYLAQRAATIGPRRNPEVNAGTPGEMKIAYATVPQQPEHGTSHVSVVDAQGDAVAMTTTIEYGFGAHVMSDGGTGLRGGFLLNNEMTDFSYLPTDAQGRPVANRIEPGKRPRSSMSPTLVFDRSPDGGLGPFRMSLGSPGGSIIIHFTAKTLVGALQWGLGPQPAIDLPNFGSFGAPLILESGRFPPATLADLRARGHEVKEVELTSGLQAIERTPEGWIGGADPRREGIVLGD
jgi:gamma-glutamyltranspeptidase/glutathione hydrolase